MFIIIIHVFCDYKKGGWKPQTYWLAQAHGGEDEVKHKQKLVVSISTLKKQAFIYVPQQFYIYVYTGMYIQARGSLFAFNLDLLKRERETWYKLFRLGDECEVAA